jgi:hypothetical protein
MGNQPTFVGKNPGLHEVRDSFGLTLVGGWVPGSGVGGGFPDHEKSARTFPGMNTTKVVAHKKLPCGGATT